MDIKKLFNLKGRKKILWKKDEIKFKKWLKANLNHLKYMDDNSDIYFEKYYKFM